MHVGAGICYGTTWARRHEVAASAFTLQRQRLARLKRNRGLANRQMATGLRPPVVTRVVIIMLADVGSGAAGAIPGKIVREGECFSIDHSSSLALIAEVGSSSIAAKAIRPKHVSGGFRRRLLDGEENSLPGNRDGKHACPRVALPKEARWVAPASHVGEGWWGSSSPGKMEKCLSPRCLPGGAGSTRWMGMVESKIPGEHGEVPVLKILHVPGGARACFQVVLTSPAGRGG